MENDKTAAKPYADLGIIALKSCKDLGESIDKRIIEIRKEDKDFAHDSKKLPQSYLIPADDIRFANGEGKVKLINSVRGKDIYILCDVGNYSCTYDIHGFKNHMGPDEHFQDIKRTISAIGGKSARTTVIMPRLYESRQDKRRGRESLDAALALQELERMGIKDILSFDVHNSAVQNAVPLVSFENIYPTYEIVKALIADEKGLFDKDKLIIISPDTGAMDRAIYYSGIIGSDIGMFYKRRDFSHVVGGKNPIVAHEYLGRDVENQNVLIVDDMICSGDSVLDIAVELKKRKANKIFIATSFAIFTEGCQMFDKFYSEGLIDRIYATNLTYVSEEVSTKPWYRNVDMTGFIAEIIDNYNYSRSLSSILNAREATKDLIYRNE